MADSFLPKITINALQKPIFKNPGFVLVSSKKTAGGWLSERSDIPGDEKRCESSPYGSWIAHLTGGDKKEKVAGSDHLEVEGSRVMRVHGNLTVVVDSAEGGNVNFQCTNFNVRASQSFNVQCGNFITKSTAKSDMSSDGGFGISAGLSGSFKSVGSMNIEATGGGSYLTLLGPGGVDMKSANGSLIADAQSVYITATLGSANIKSVTGSSLRSTAGVTISGGGGSFGINMVAGVSIDTKTTLTINAGEEMTILSPILSALESVTTLMELTVETTSTLTGPVDTAATIVATGPITSMANFITKGGAWNAIGHVHGLVETGTSASGPSLP